MTCMRGHQHLAPSVRPAEPAHAVRADPFPDPHGSLPPLIPLASGPGTTQAPMSLWCTSLQGGTGQRGAIQLCSWPTSHPRTRRGLFPALPLPVAAGRAALVGAQYFLPKPAEGQPLSPGPSSLAGGRCQPGALTGKTLFLWGEGPLLCQRSEPTLPYTCFLGT